MKAAGNLISGLMFLLFFSGCESPVSFNEPQPPDTNSLNEFPNFLKGDYLNKESNSILRINDKQIVRIYDIEQKISIGNIDSTFKIIGDTLINLNDSSKTFVNFESDSIAIHFHSEDTLFSISRRNVLKKFKGNYFLSFGDSTNWKIKKLYLAKGILSVSQISTDEEIRSLRGITETTSDTTSYNFKPTKKQFSNFIKKNDLKDVEYYIRLKNGYSN